MLPSQEITEELLKSLMDVPRDGKTYSELFKEYCEIYTARAGRLPKLKLTQGFTLPKRLGSNGWAQAKKEPGEVLTIMGFEKGKKESWLVVCADGDTFQTSTPYVLRPDGHIKKFGVEISDVSKANPAKPKPARTPAPAKSQPKLDLQAELAKARQERADITWI